MALKEHYNRSLGQVVSLIGLQGVMKVLPSSNNPNLFLNAKNVLLTNKDSSLEAKVKQINLVKGYLQIKLEQYDTRTSVEPLLKANIYIPEVELKPLAKNEWWVRDLIGLSVYTSNGELVGIICGAPGEHGEFLEIQKINNNKAGETVIISFVKELFPVVDLESKRVELADVPGLLDL